MNLQVNAEQSQGINCFELSINRENLDIKGNPCSIGSLVAFKMFPSQKVESIGIVVEVEYLLFADTDKWECSVLVGGEVEVGINIDPSTFRILSKDHNYNIFNILNPPKFTIGDLVLGYIQYDKAWSDCSHGCLIVSAMKYSPIKDEFSKSIHQWLYLLCWYCEDGTIGDAVGMFEEDQLLKITATKLPESEWHEWSYEDENFHYEPRIVKMTFAIAHEQPLLNSKARTVEAVARANLM